MEDIPVAEQAVSLVSIEITERQQQVLGCLACLSNCGDSFVAEARPQVAACTGLTREQVNRTFMALEKHELVDKQPRTTPPKPGTPNPSRNEHTVNTRGRTLLPTTWQACEKQDPQDPLASLSNLQRSYLRCVSCLISRDKEPTSHDIGDCLGRTSGVASDALSKLAAQGFLDKSNATREQATTSKAQHKYTPGALAESHMPKPPSALDCRQFNKEAEKLFARFTEQQRRILGCAACLSARSKCKEVAGIENQPIADCLDVSVVTVTKTTARMRELGIFEASTGFAQTSKRTIYTPTALGRRLFTIPTLADTCTQSDSAVEPEVIQLDNAVSGCMGCIWSKQMALEEKPAASNAMISHCTGLSVKSVRLAAGKMANEGRIKRTVSPINVMSNNRIPTVVYSPAAYLRALPGVGRNCTLPLYTGVPEHYIRPLSKDALALPPRPKPSEIFKDPWFIESSSYAPLTAEEEVTLGQTIQSGGDPEQAKAAIETFVKHNFRLALWGVKRAKGELIFLPYEDAVLVAQQAILTAVERFDPTMGTKFSSYAAHWLRVKLQRAAADCIDVPERDYDLFPKLFYAMKDFQTHYNRPPSIVELSRDVQLRPKQVDRVLQRYQYAVSQLTMRLDGYLNEEEQTSTFYNLAGQNDPGLATVDVMHSFERLNQYLSPVERDVLANIIENKETPIPNILAAHDINPSQASDTRSRVMSLLQHPFFGILAALNESFDWQADAACSKLNHDQVVTKRQGRIGNETIRICQACPINKQCETYAAKAHTTLTAGIWNAKRPSYTTASTE